MLDKIAPQLREWVQHNDELRPNAKTFSLNQIKELRPRAITRDMDWGVPLPRGYELNDDNQKVLYVWFEAVTGYLSASIEWAKSQGDADKWKEWWLDEEAEHIYAMGKDNVPFHTIIWPAMLMGASEKDTHKLHLPTKIASTEFLTLGDGKFSSSRGNTIFIKDLIDEVGVDVTRFYLLNNGPETHDKVFNVEELVTVNNDELLAKWGNLVQRVLKLTVTNFDGQVPDVDLSDLPDEHSILTNKIKNTYEDAGDLLDAAKFSAATRRILALCVDTNRFLNDQEPWKTAKIDLVKTATTLYSSLTAIDNLSHLFTPIMPSSSQKVHELLGYEDSLTGRIYEHTTKDGTTVITGDYESTKNIWHYAQIQPKQTVKVGEHLFSKLDSATVTKNLSK